MIKRKILELYWALKDYNELHDSQINSDFAEDRIAANIIRLTHSIEKGLSIENPRIGFGISKISSILDYSEQYLKLPDPNLTCIQIASDALFQYFDFHDRKDFKSKEYLNLKKRYSDILAQYTSDGSINGGVKLLSLSELDYDIETIKTFFYTRHSIRQFANIKLQVDDIRKAVILAQRAPSACNRQAVRVYLVPAKKYVEDTNSDLEGIGGFTDDVEYFLIITGKLSAYDEFEYKQFVVSAGVFAGYLTLALHAYKIGACVIQRSIRKNDKWDAFRIKNNISKDEQIVLMIGIGSMKEETLVPVSKRYDVDEIFKVL